MSTQNATVSLAPAYAILSKLFSGWGYNKSGRAFFSCTGQPVSIQQISVTWDGAKLTINGAVEAPCTGPFLWFDFTLSDTSNNITGTGGVSDLNISVTQYQSLSIYYIENLSKPTTAPVQVL